MTTPPTEDTPHHAFLTPEIEARQLAAVDLARQGFSIVHVFGVTEDGCRCPKGGDCRAPGKHGGKGWLEHASRDPEVIRKRLLRDQSNYGVAPPSGSRLLIVDEDVPGALEAFGPLPDTLIVATGPRSEGLRGRHVYGRLPDGIDESAIPYQWAGGEVRIAGNGCVVGPLCHHRSGVIYEPLNSSGVGQLSEAWVRALIASGRLRRAQQDAARDASEPGWFIEHGRHDWLLARGVGMRGHGIVGDVLFDQLTQLDRRRCRPPLSDTPGRGSDEVGAIVAWVMDHVEDDPPGTVVGGSQEAPREAVTIGAQTLADLPWGDPPAQLCDPFLTPDGVTVLYGPGGVGKGMLSVFFALRLVRAGMRVMILDYEHHEREWGNRARALGYTDDELALVQYRAPFGDGWTAKRGALNEVAELVRADCEELGIGYLVVDSFTTATSTGDSMGGADAAQSFFVGITRIGRPALVIAHVAGASGRFPARPFGSVFVHNLARETWAVESVGTEDQEPFDPALARMLPSVMSLELRNKKMNVGPKPKSQFISFSLFMDGHVEVDQQAPVSRSISELAVDVLSRASAPMTVKAIASAIKADTGEVVGEAQLRTVFSRSRGRFVSEGAPKKWRLVEDL